MLFTWNSLFDIIDVIYNFIMLFAIKINDDVFEFLVRFSFIGGANF